MSPKPKIEHVILRRALGVNERIPISQSEYSRICSSRSVLSEILSLEEKFFAICEQHKDIEKFIFDNTIENMIYSFSNVSDIHQVSTGFSRLLSSFLSIYRMYADSAYTHVREVSNKKIDKNTVKQVFSEQYDKSLHYRAMEAIRNYAQHHAFPVHSSTHGNKWNDERTKMLVSTDFYFMPEHIKGDKGFKTSVLEEITENGEKFNLKIALREYFGAICDIHTNIRAILLPYKSESMKCIEEYRNKWHLQYDDEKLTGVVACKFIDDLLDNQSDIAYLDLQVDEYREMMEKKTASIVNMQKRTFVF